MFAVNDAICNSLRTKKKWIKETCVLCSVPVSQCQKLIRDEEEQSRRFDERPDFIRENRGKDDETSEANQVSVAQD